MTNQGPAPSPPIIGATGQNGEAGPARANGSSQASSPSGRPCVRRRLPADAPPLRFRNCHARAPPPCRHRNPRPNASPPDGGAYQRTVSRNCTPCSGALSFAASRRVPSRLIARVGASDQRAPARHVRFPASANATARTCGRWLNNRAENSHQPFRRREGAMARFRDIKTLQKFSSVHASIYNHFNHERHLNRRDIFKQARTAALAEWCQLAA